MTCLNDRSLCLVIIIISFFHLSFINLNFCDTLFLHVSRHVSSLCSFLLLFSGDLQWHLHLLSSFLFLRLPLSRFFSHLKHHNHWQCHICQQPCILCIHCILFLSLRHMLIVATGVLHFCDSLLQRVRSNWVQRQESCHCCCKSHTHRHIVLLQSPKGVIHCLLQIIASSLYKIYYTVILFCNIPLFISIIRTTTTTTTIISTISTQYEQL